MYYFLFILAKTALLKRRSVVSRPLTVRQMATRLKLYRLCRLVAAQISDQQDKIQK